jgi:SAM-dependent methyltransferase
LKDTDRDWRVIADSSPYFGVLSHEHFRDPSPVDLQEFFATGETDIATYLATIHRIFGPFEPRSALDFGCGVGRVLIPLAKLTGDATGVDIADGMLSLARYHAEQANTPVTLTTTIPANRTFDWVNSQIVLQHIPPRRGYPIISNLWRAVAPNGLLVLHVTTFRDGAHTAELVRDFSIISYDAERVVGYMEATDRRPVVSMYDYDLNRVFACMPMADGSPVYMEKTNHGGFYGFRIYLRKPNADPADSVNLAEAG